MIGKTCPGYLDPWDLNLRLENDSLRARVMDAPFLSQTSSKYEPKDRARDSTRQTIDTEFDSQLEQSDGTLLAGQATQSEENHFIDSFFDDFIRSDSQDVDSGYLKRLPCMFASSLPTSPLRLAVRAAAYSYASNKSAASQLQIKAREIYGFSLQVLRSELDNQVSMTSNATLMTILVLRLYEVCWSVLWIAMRPINYCSTLPEMIIKTIGMLTERVCGS